jgi:hypothetical protein
MKKAIYVLLVLLAACAANAANISGVNTLTTDAKMYAYSICALVGVGACLLFLVDLRSGMSKFLAVTIAVIGIASITAWIAYIRGAFGG